MGAGSQELTERAKLLISERRYQEAVRACRRALLSKPDQVDLRLLLGEALLALERYDEVRVEMMALARKNPDVAAVHRLLGEAYLRDHRPTQAVESLRRALELDPTDEVAEELLNEAADENAPVSTTIERWFADEAEPTTEGPPPDWAEDEIRGGATSPRAAAGGPNIEVDPALTAQIRMPDAGRTNPAQMTPEAAGPPVAPPPDPPSLGMANDIAPPLAPMDSGGYGGSGAGQPSPFAPPHIEGPALPHGDLPLSEPIPPPREAVTEAARPSVKRLLDHEHIDDYELLASDEVEELENEPTRALAADMPIAPRIRDLDDDFADAPTNAIDIGDLEAEPTRAHVSQEPATRAQIGPVTTSEPPTRAHISTAALDGARGVQYETPSVPNEALEETGLPKAGAPKAPQIETERVRPKKKRGMLVPILVGGLLLMGVLAGGGFALMQYLTASDVADLRASAAQAGDTGLAADLEAVVERIGDAEDPQLRALKARLLATLTLEHGEDHTSDVQSILSALPADDSLNDAKIGAALLALAQQQPEAALQELSGLAVEDDQIPEAFRARALALAAQGDWAPAAQAAQRAFDVRSGSPRHLALHAAMLHRTNNTAGARTLLEGFEDASTEPAIRVTLARVLLESGADPERAVQEANAVVRELERTATPYHLSWAHLVLGYAAAERGDVAEAVSQANLAREHMPPSDESFGLRLVNTYLIAGHPEDADNALERLPEPTVDEDARRLLSARVALARGDLDRAEEEIGEAGQGARQNFIRARILEERGQIEEARPLYETAMADPGPEGRRARVRLAAIEFAQGAPRNTIRYLEEFQTEAVDDPDLIPLLARAYIAEDRPEDARPILETALSRRPTAPALLAAQGELLLHEGNPAEALEPLRRAAVVRDTDADIQANLGQAAFLTGELGEARAAWSAALEQNERQATALIGLARVALQEREYDQVDERLAALEAANAEPAMVAQLRAELLVRRGDGQAGIETLLALTRRFATDAAIWSALGELQAQAESDRDAARSFDRALRIDESRIDTLLARSLVEVRRGDLSNARRSVQTAEQSLGDDGASPRLLARAKVSRARIEFETGDWGTVGRLAREAIELDERAAGAHLLLAIMAIEGRGDGDPIPHLRRAVEGDAPPPEALAQLARRLPSSDREESCRLARRYMAVAPNGYDASDVRRVVQRCR